MQSPIKGNEGYGVLRAFGAVAALVALYGVSLSAAALMEPPREANSKPVVWYGPVAAAMEQRFQLTSTATSAPARGGSFWTSYATSGEASPTNAAVSAAAAASFWRERNADQALIGSQLAGDVDRIRGNM